MEAYQGFARVYDLFMDNVPYRHWADYMIQTLTEHNISDGLVLELGCGTGKMTRLLARAGYDMIGVDSSVEMLEIAAEAEENKKERTILYLNQDMREFELYGTVRAVVSCCDSLNYILEEKELLDVFSLVCNYLDPGGIFLFDFNTVYAYRELLGDRSICENRDSCSFIWENYYHEKECVNEYDLTLFVRNEQDLYRKYEETHYQRGYESDLVRQLLERAGFVFEAAYDAYTKEPVRKTSARVSVIAKKYH